MSARDSGLCECGHYWSVHKDGCTGWRHPDHTPRWAKALRRFRVVVLLRCKCSWSYTLVPPEYRRNWSAVGVQEHTEEQG